MHKAQTILFLIALLA